MSKKKAKAKNMNPVGVNEIPEDTIEDILNDSSEAEIDLEDSIEKQYAALKETPEETPEEEEEEDNSKQLKCSRCGNIYDKYITTGNEVVTCPECSAPASWKN